MGKKSGGGSQTVTQKNDPPEMVKPHLAQLYASTGDWFKSGPAGTYQGPRVAETPWDMLHGMNMKRSIATDGNPLQQFASGATMNVLNGTNIGNNPVGNGQMLSENQWARGDFGKQNMEANGHWLNGDTNPLIKSLQSNQFQTGENNPYLHGMVTAATRSMKDDFMESIAPSLASQFSQAGRTGSGAHIGAFTGATSKLGERLGDVTSNMYGAAFENERSRALDAWKTTSGLSSNALNAERDRMSQAYEAERQRQYGSYEAERGAQRGFLANIPQMQMQAASMAPALRQMQYDDADQLTASGDTQRLLQQQYFDSEQNKFNETRDEPLQRLMAYSSILSGATPYVNQSTQSTSTQPRNRLTGAIGGGLSGAMLGPMLGMTGPVGAGIGALMGLFG